MKENFIQRPNKVPDKRSAYIKKKCTRNKLLSANIKLREKNVQRMKHVMKMSEIVSRWDQLKKKEETYIYTGVQGLSDQCHGDLVKRKLKNEKTIEEAQEAEDELEQLRFERIEQSYEIARMNPIFPKVDGLSSFHIQNIEAPLVFDIQDEEIPANNEDHVKDVFFRTSSCGDNLHLSIDHTSYIKHGMKQLFDHLKLIIDIYQVCTPFHLENQTITFLMMRPATMNLENRENISKYVTFINFVWVSVLQHFFKELDYIPNVDFPLLQKYFSLRRRKLLDTAAEIKFSKFGDYDKLSFPPLFANFACFDRIIEFSSTSNHMTDSDDEFVFVDDDF